MFARQCYVVVAIVWVDSVSGDARGCVLLVMLCCLVERGVLRLPVLFILHCVACHCISLHGIALRGCG